MQEIRLNEAAAQDFFSVICSRVNDNHEPLVVTYEHHKSVVIMNLEDFNSLPKTTYLSEIVRRKPSAKIAGKGKILGDIITPVVPVEDWEALA